MTYTPQHIANYFLDRARDENRTLDQLKLMKLVYIAYGWHLALTGKKLFNEDIQAWQHGPVVRSLYDEFKHFGRSPITQRATEFDMDTFDLTVPEIPESDADVRLILDKVWAAYKRFNGWQLREKTHEAGTPWSMTYQEGARDQIIPDETIRPHFLTIIRKILDAARASTPATV
ncbi:SocA family protein [Sphingobium sp. BHU LFT2]|uniref:Panacea domain-containing protein n=1 Tax=Sphingobium sp. BHU LFT2 TaxID=2807634 RepID=UPI001BE8EA87|nr:type II toxin-antitoxin system antitoxin SocA domain-containing protein [Sphingobium sp. BHU LFT2]MBT2242699.1 SocA family protein [Sphingobium sp. BHU LFT2]